MQNLILDQNYNFLKISIPKPQKTKGSKSWIKKYKRIKIVI